MRYCPKRKEEVDEKMVCLEKCTFWHPEKLFPCTFKNWVPGLKKGRDTENEDYNEGLGDFPKEHI